MLQKSAGQVLTISDLWVALFTVVWALIGGVAGMGLGPVFKDAFSGGQPKGWYLDPDTYPFLAGEIGRCSLVYVVTLSPHT